MFRGQPIKTPYFLAIEMRDILSIFKHARHMEFVYSRYSLRDLIATILSMNQYVGYNESLWFELERRFGEEISLDPRLDPNTLDLSFEILTHATDEHIRSRVPRVIDTSDYVFDKWVDATTIVMKRDETVQLYRDYGTNEHFSPIQQFYPRGTDQSRALL